MPEGHGEQMSRRKEEAISALLRSRSVRAAARALEPPVDEATLRSWLKDPSFLGDYRAARRAVVEAAIGQLQRSSAGAVRTLHKCLKAPRHSDQIAAARTILDMAVKAVELIDLAERVERLEQAAERDKS